jgi:hypothetical protein
MTMNIALTGELDLLVVIEAVPAVANPPPDARGTTIMTARRMFDPIGIVTVTGIVDGIGMMIKIIAETETVTETGGPVMIDTAARGIHLLDTTGTEIETTTLAEVDGTNNIQWYE